MRKILVTSIAACILLHDPALGSAQDLEHRGVPIAWQYGLNVPAGTIRGFVADADGRPLTSAQISIERTRHGAIPGPDGRFEITGLRPGPAEIKIQGIGFESATLSLVIPSDAGVTIAAIIPATSIGGRCGDLVPRGDGIYAEVVDSVTGSTPKVPITLRLDRDGAVWERTQVVDVPQGRRVLLRLPHRIETPGVYNIQVTAPGYRPWRLEQVQMDLELAVCAISAKNRNVSVKLVPLR